MAQDNRSGPLDRTALWILAAALFLTPLLHVGTLLDPFVFPRRLVVIGAALLITGLAVARRLATDEEETIVSPAFPGAAGFAAFAGLAALLSSHRGLALWGLLEIAAGVAILWGAAQCVRRPRDAGLLFGAWLASAAVIAAATLAQAFAPGFSLAVAGISIVPPGRAGAMFGDPAAATQMLLLALPAGIGAAMLAGGRARLVWGALIGLVVTALFFAGRPEGWVVGAVVAGVLLMTRVAQVALSGGRWERLAPRLAGDGLRAALAAVVVIVAVLVGARIVSTVPGGVRVAPLDNVHLVGPTTGDAVADRRAAVPATLRLVARHPLGIGPASWRHGFLEVAWAGGGSPFSLSHQAVHAGNSYAEAAAEAGVPGVLFLALLLATLLLQAGGAAARAPGAWSAAGYASFNVLFAAAVIAVAGTVFQEPAAALLFYSVGGVTQAVALAAGGGRFARLMPRRRVLTPRALRGARAGMMVAVAWAVFAVAVAVLAAQRWQGLRLAASAHASLFAGRPQDAVLALGQPAARRLPDPLARLLMANGYVRLGFYDRAAAEFDETLKRSPYFPAAHLGRAAARLEQGRYDLAEEDLKRALAIWPDSADTHVAFGRLNTARGRLDDAIENYRAAMGLDRTLPEPYLLTGDLYMRRNRLDEAIEAYRVTGMKNPRYPGLHLRLGDAYAKKGLTEMALRHFQAAATADEKAVEPRLRIANAHHNMGEHCEAMQALEAARDLEIDADRRAGILETISRIEPLCRKQKKGAARG